MLNYFYHVFSYRDDSNGPSGLKIGPLLRKLWTNQFQSLKAQGHKSLWGTRVRGWKGMRTQVYEGRKDMRAERVRGHEGSLN